jgi:diguanylate cyclase (GGDEF)-like protein
MKNFLAIKTTNGTSFQPLEEEVYSIGRSSLCNISVKSKGMSRVHATIYHSNDSYWIVDGAIDGSPSTNGLSVNGKKVTIKKLDRHDIVVFSKDAYAIFLEFKLDSNSRNLFEQLENALSLFYSEKNIKDFFPFYDTEAHDIVDKTVTIKKTDLHLDDLTDLPNRNFFLRRIERSFEYRKQISEEHKFAILFVDVDRFKMINDSLGHHAGDEFLVQISKRFKNSLREHDMVARIGGDEFAILLDYLSDYAEAITIAERLHNAMAKPMLVANQEIYPSISIGIASNALGYKSTEEMIRDADTAMYHAKASGRGRFVTFDEKMHQQAKEVFHLHVDLRKAIKNQELQLYYQPIISIREKCLVGFEALLRWKHPEKGWISPDIFIPIAEETNLIYEIGMWVLDKACYQLRIWRSKSSIKSSISMNVNLSAKQLFYSSLMQEITQTIQKHKVNPSELKIEVTETSIMENIQQAVGVFQQMKKLGIQLAIDDFGTGYSSLSYLNRFPIDTLKIDRSFISKMNECDDNNSSINITNSIIALAHSLGVKVVAEGVENLYHLLYLKNLKCDYAQGYLFSKPLDTEAATLLAEKGIDWKWKD